MKKTANDYIMYLTLVVLGLTGVNALLEVMAISYPLLGTIVMILGFFGILAITYGYNEFKFRSLLDLALYCVNIGIFGLVGVGAGSLIPSGTPFVMQIFKGFQPLLIAVTVGGFVGAIVGMVNLGSIKKTK